jgi:excisionase family DNA binding protein
MLQLPKMQGVFRMPQEPQSQYYTVEEAAIILGVHPETIRRMCKRQELRGARKVGDTWRIPRASVDAQPEQPNTENKA